MSRLSRLHKHEEEFRSSLIKAFAAVAAGLVAGLMALQFVPLVNPVREAASMPAGDPGATPKPVPVVSSPPTAVNPQPPASSPPAPAQPALTPDTAPVQAPANQANAGHPLLRALEEHFAAYPGRWAMVIVDLNSGERWEHNAQDRFHPASTIKMPVTLFALHQHMNGRLGWEELVTYLPEDFESPGGGAFETSPFYGKYPVSNLVHRALAYSNNVAVNMLGRTLGWQNVRDFTRTIEGELYRAEGGRPEITAASAAAWWLHLLELKESAPEQADLLLKSLGQVSYQARIAEGIPSGTSYLHKFGSYDGNHHDTGVVYGSTPYVITVLTAGMQEAEADRAIAGASRIVWNHFHSE